LKLRLPKLTAAVLAWRCRRYRRLIWLSVDGALDARQRILLKAHLPRCVRCRSESEELRFACQQISLLQLPRDVPIEFPLWLKAQATAHAPARDGFARPRWAVAATMAVLSLAGALTWHLRRPTNADWAVTRLAGAPAVGTAAITKHGQIGVGDWLETDGASRALIRVGKIGHVEIEPGSRLQLLAARADDHRLSLVKGRLHAVIVAPPRLFFIETPSAVAIDYGCAYTLEVDESGASLLQVTAGWVSLKALDPIAGHPVGRESLAPAGAVCRALPGKGPGTPFFPDASEKFRQALDRLDFGDGGREALTVILAEARKRDSLTLFHLLPRATEVERPRVYDRLAAFVPPPAGLTRADVLQPGNADKLDTWREQIEFVGVGGNPADLPKATGTLRPTGTLNAARHSHSATLLTDGRVLIAGGAERDRGPLNSSEIYDPETGQFTPAGRLTAGRAGHTATLLHDGRVLLAGGGWHGLASAELYDPAANTFRAVGNLSVPRVSHQATLLPDGSVLITGGQRDNGNKLASAELYDPATQSFSPVGSMHTPRIDHTATLLNTGQVLIVGGGSRGDLGDAPVAGVELYDPAKKIFVPAGALSIPRYKHAAALLPDGRVIVLGGTGVRLWEDRRASAEIYDPVTGKFAPTGSLNTARYKIRDAVLLLPNGKILVAGGGARLELFDPATGIFSAVSGGVGAARQYATATLLPDGEVLIVGGYLNGLPNLTADVSAWLYRP
jgi:Putative zinc-finger/Galactose oxidase, central domain